MARGTLLEERLSFQSRKLWRGVFVVSFLLRAYFAFEFSYIHPDEHLQGPQIVAREHFGWAAQDVWDFREPGAVRSHVPLWLVYGLPMSFFTDHAQPLRILYVIRAVIAILTWILSDMAIDRLSRTKSEQLRGLLFVSTCYVTWVHQSRTLSNSLETILVLWYLVIIHEFQVTKTTPFDRHTDCLLLASIAAVGTFNRPTFVAWVLLPSFSLLPFFWSYKLTAFTFVFGLMASVSLLIYVDTILYGADDWVIAPLNNVRYNLSDRNLSIHGLHPQWVHLLVNLPQLLGPGLFLLRPNWTSLSMQSALSGIVALSFSKHQEARFLVPIIPLLCMNMDISQFGANLQWLLMALWLLFNVVVGILMGVFHQGGVIPAQTFLRDIPTPASIIWWRTYSPPLWLLGEAHEAITYVDAGTSSLDNMIEMGKRNSAKFFIADLQGSPSDDLQRALKNFPRPIYLVSPTANGIGAFDDAAELVYHRWTHSSLELYDIHRLQSFEPGLAIWRFN